MDQGCLKKGCFGCGAGLVLIIAIPLVLLGIGLALGVPKSQQENQVLQQSLPPGEEGATETAATAEEGGSPATSAPDFVERPLMPDSLGTPAAGKIILDLEEGDFLVEPGPADLSGEGLRVEADYDSGLFDLQESYEVQDDGTWTYRLSFESKVAWYRRLWVGDQDIRNKVRLIIPRGHPMEISGAIRKGQSRVELGGLWLTEVDLKTTMGDHRVSFSEPLPQPLNWLRLEGGMGEADFRGLGNAGPAKAYIESKMGEMRVDLGGEWRQDSVVDVKFSMGECRIIAPHNVHLKVDRAGVTMGERSLRNLEPSEILPEDAPTLTLRADTSMGELRIERAREPRETPAEPPVEAQPETPPDPDLQFPTE
jgi:hypothetical protein